MRFHDFCSQIFVHKNNGQIWSFHISNNSIFYRIIVDNMPVKRIKLIDNIKTYDVSMDSLGNIDLVCVKDNNELIYFNHSNDGWKRKTFKKKNSKSDINFVNILNINNSIHIFYSFRNPSENKPYKVFHIYSHDNQWRYNYLAPVMISKNIKPYFLDCNKSGEILFLYKFNANTKNRGKIYIKTFDTKKNRWSSAVNLKFKSENVRILNLLIDSKDKIHFVFKEDNSVKYLGQHFYDFNNMMGSLQLKNQISLGDMAGVYHIFEIDNSLLISWKRDNKLCQISPENQGDSLIEKELYESNNIFNVKYLGAHYIDKSISKPLVTFGTDRNNKTLILGLDKDFFEEEKTKLSEEDSDLDRSWYGDDEEILDPIDDILTETEEDKEEDFPNTADDLLVENEIEKDLTISKEEVNSEIEITEPTSYLDDGLPKINDDSTVRNELENDFDSHKEKIDCEDDIVEPEPCINDELPKEEEPDNIGIFNDENIQNQCILSTDVESSEKVDDNIVKKETPEEVKTAAKKSIFKRMKDYLTSNQEEDC